MGYTFPLPAYIGRGFLRIISMTKDEGVPRAGGDGPISQEAGKALLQLCAENGIVIDEARLAEIEMKAGWKKLEEKYRPWQDPEGKRYRYWHVSFGKGKNRAVKTRSSYEGIMALIEEYDRTHGRDPTVGALYREWLRDKVCHNEITKSTADRYDRDFERFFSGIKDREAGDFSPGDLEKLVKDAICSMGLTQRAYARMRTILIGVFRLAKKKGLVSFSINEEVKGFDISKKSFARPPGKKGAYTASEAALIEAEVRKDPELLGLGISLDLRLGGRIGELAGISWEDVDWERGTVSIRRTESIRKEDGGWSYEPREGAKTEAGVRTVVLPDSAMGILREIRELSPGDGYVFERDGRRLRSYQFRNRMVTLCRRAGVEYRGTHAVRRSCASVMIDAGVPCALVAGQLGHTDINTTLSYYYRDMSDYEGKKEALNRAFGEQRPL